VTQSTTEPYYSGNGANTFEEKRIGRQPRGKGEGGLAPGNRPVLKKMGILKKRRVVTAKNGNTFVFTTMLAKGGSPKGGESCLDQPRCPPDMLRDRRRTTKEGEKRKS